ncbi:MAG: hypothetical protein M1828_007016 [Chrysothrix sp. TS-e1954]|nr:MAG: hypothetical protein M1828_007016 [Chrysothrix sp. TS-e1954]
MAALNLLIEALNVLSPREDGCAQFKAFFARGSKHECAELLPDSETAKPTSQSAGSTAQKEMTCYQNDQASGRKRKRTPTTSVLDPVRPITATVPENPIERGCNARAFFGRHFPPGDKRVERLLDVTRDLCTDVPDESILTFWSDRRAVFGCNETPRLRRLMLGRALMTRDYECARRFGLIFLRHEVDALRHQRPKGHPNRAWAVDKFAEQTQLDRKRVRKDLRKADKYETLLHEVGPGILLVLGKSKAWL